MNNLKIIIIGGLILLCASLIILLDSEPSPSPPKEKNVTLSDSETTLDSYHEGSFKDRSNVKKSSNTRSEIELLRDSSKKTDCYNISSSDKSHYENLVTKFSQENVLFPRAVLQYLTEMDKEELVLEFESGNSSAAYVLGMNYFYSSYNSEWHNPFLSMVSRQKADSPKPFDLKTMERARDWLWKAALNGIPTALLEIGNSYSYENSFMIKESLSKEKSSEYKSVHSQVLEAKSLAYKVLFEHVTRGYREFSGQGGINYAEAFKNIEMKEKEAILERLKESWSKQRNELGKEMYVELFVPEKVTQAIERMQKRCKTKSTL